MVNVGFVGLGVMGYHMARHVARKFPIVVFNRSRNKSERFVEENSGAVKADTPREVAEASDIVLMCVGNDNDVRAVVDGDDGIKSGLKPDAILVDHTTTSATLAHELAHTTAAVGAHFIDAPVSGGEAGAQNGQLVVMCGGDAAVFAKAQPVITCFAKNSELIGGTGCGQLTKMVNQIAIAGLLQGLAEALNFGKKSGLNMEKVLGVIGGGAAQSWQMNNRSPTMLNDEFDFGFKVQWMLKDLGFCQDHANQHDIKIPIAGVVKSYYQQLLDQGYADADTSSLIKLL